MNDLKNDLKGAMTSLRFWAGVVTALSVFLNGLVNADTVTMQLFLTGFFEFVITVSAWFTGIRTVDRFSEKLAIKQ